MANLRQAFEYASQNPDSDFAKNLEQLAASGSLDGEAKKYGIDLTPFKPEQTLGSKLIGRAKDLGHEVAAIGTLGASTLSPEDIAMAKGDKNQMNLLALQSGLRAAEAPIRAVGAVGGAVGDIIGAGLSQIGADKAIGGAISPVLQNEQVKKAVDLYNTLPQDTKDVLGAILNTANIPLGGIGSGAVKSSIESGVKATAGAGAKAVKAVTPDASAIMQRVARIPKQKQIKFQNTAGESVGEYLTKRGVYGDEEQIVEQLYKRYVDSKKVADDALEQLPGTFKPQQVADALDMLEEKFTKSSTKGVKDPNLSRVEELIAKYNAEGLTMPEVNEAKRLFEKNAKLDFARENNPDGIRLANNVDNSIREWQFNQAEQLGLKNLPEINRETRLARQLMDDLGAESAGIAGNNAVSLTDWIVLAEGNPASIAAFLGKKAAASKKLQSAVAKKVAGKPTVGQPEAIFTGSKPATSLPEQKLLPQSSPKSTPSEIKSKGIRGMINFSEFIPKLESDLSLASNAKSKDLKLSSTEDIASKLNDAGIDVGVVTEKNADNILNIANEFISMKKNELKNAEMNTPAVKMMQDRTKKKVVSLEQEAGNYTNGKDFYSRISSKSLDELRSKGIKGEEQITNWFNKNITPKEQVMTSVNPTGSLYVDYTPKDRMTMKLGKNMTTLDKTSGKSPGTLITIYRGAPKTQKQIVGGDFITTNYDLAKSYAGNGHVLESKVKMKDILDDSESPLGDEYIYRPQK